MDYLSVDFTSFPLRTMCSTVVKKRLVVQDYALGPQDRKDEQDWLREWINTKRHWWKPTTLLAVWDSPALSSRIQVEKIETSKPEAISESEEKEEDKPSPTQEEHHEESDECLAYRCSLVRPVLCNDNSETDSSFELVVQIPQKTNDELLENMQALGANCRQITVLPLAIWSAFLMSYPDYLDRTVAVAWRSREALIVVVVHRGQLVFSRHFMAHEFNSDAWVVRVKECLENFSFLFPKFQIDLVLFGGDQKNQTEIREWISECMGCPCELVLPFHSGQIGWMKQDNNNDEKDLSPYWSCMGMVWGHLFAWR